MATARHWAFDARSARDVGNALTSALGLPRVPHLGRANGDWIIDDSLTELLDNLSRLPAGLWRPFELRVFYASNGKVLTSADDLRGDLRRDVVGVVMDHERKHYALVLVDSVARTATVFDSLHSWSNGQAARAVATMFPHARGLKPVNASNLVRQKGCECGAWVLWAAVCFALNVCDFRRDARKALGLSPLGFWKAVSV